jgi:hypothetical protein
MFYVRVCHFGLRRPRSFSQVENLMPGPGFNRRDTVKSAIVLLHPVIVH